MASFWAYCFEMINLFFFKKELVYLSKSYLIPHLKKVKISLIDNYAGSGLAKNLDHMSSTYVRKLMQIVGEINMKKGRYPK